MVRILFPLIALLAPVFCHAAAYTVRPVAAAWESSIRPVSYRLNGVATDAGGNVFVLGNFGETDTPTLAKYAAADGQLLWEYKGDGETVLRLPYQMMIDSNGDVAVLYRYSGNDRFLGVGKFSGATGTWLWRTDISTSPNSFNHLFYMALNPAGDVAVSGSVAKPGQAPNTGSPSYYTALLDSATGALRWSTDQISTTPPTFLPDGNIFLGHVVLSVTDGSVLHSYNTYDQSYVFSTPAGDVLRAGLYTSSSVAFEKVTPAGNTLARVWFKEVKSTILYDHFSLLNVKLDASNRLGFTAREYLGQDQSDTMDQAGVVDQDGQVLWRRQIVPPTTGGGYGVGVDFNTTGDVLFAYQTAAVEPDGFYGTLARGFNVQSGAEEFRVRVPYLYFPYGGLGLCVLPDDAFALAGTDGVGLKGSTVQKYRVLPPLTGEISAALVNGSPVVLATAGSSAMMPFRVHVEWGETEAYGHTSPDQVVDGTSGYSTAAAWTLTQLPQGTYHYRLVFDGDFKTAWSEDQTITIPNYPPTAVDDTVTTQLETAITIDPTANDVEINFADPLTLVTCTPADPDALHGTLAINGNQVQYTPERNFLGQVELDYTVRDPQGAAATAKIRISVTRPATPVFHLIAATGQAVPDSLNGETFRSFTNAISMPFLAEIENGDGRKVMLIDREGRISRNPDPNVAKVSPAAGPAFVFQFQHDGTTDASNDAAIFALTPDGWSLIVRTGDSLGDLQADRFLAVDATSVPTIFFLAKVRGDGVTAANDVALFATTRNQAPRSLVREGDLVNGQPVTGLAVLAPAAHSAAEGRWVHGDSVLVRLTLEKTGQELYSIPATAASPADWVRIAGTGDDLTVAGQGDEIQAVGFPAAGPGAVAYLATVRQEKPRLSRKAIVLDRGQGAEVQAWSGQGVPARKSTITSLADPLLGANGRLAFEAGLRSRQTGADSRAIFYGLTGATSPVAQTGAVAIGAGKARWSAFRSIAVLDGDVHGLAFTGSLQPGSGGVNATNNLGLWATDSAGALRLVLRTGQKIMANGAERKVSNFTALAAAEPYGPAGARGYDAGGHLYVQATFADRTQAVFEIVLP